MASKSGFWTTLKKSIFPLPSLYLPFCGSRPRSGQEGRGRRLERGPWELQLLGYRQILVGDQGVQDGKDHHGADSLDYLREAQVGFE